MKTFEAPEVEVLIFATEDVVATETSFVPGDNELPIG